ncbi:K02A2.6-like [Cordylochernes scorpioides]|uniref:K02A2.6-like n=1 Tax=Cordylochernes scorpioides TaxID=51811 RepID=A0ABY6KRI8_9ARAC|nr:K02A2.6-like [Cordylochernes scorpioides]
MDLCQFEGKHFLVITDYYSCYPEFSRLDNLSAETVILHTKSIFARHGIPKLVRMDKGPQFKNYLFQNFEKRFGFRHIMSSPKYLQSNVMAESAVKMIKARLMKSQDPYLGLLAYRTTPLENGFSPSELLMGRKLRTDLPTHPDLLKPTLVNQGLLNQKEHKYRERERRNYNNHWKFDVRDQVWVRDLKVPGTIIGRANQPRSYLVKSPKGQLRRNKIHLAPNYKHKVSRECEEKIFPLSRLSLHTGTDFLKELNDGRFETLSPELNPDFDLGQVFFQQICGFNSQAAASLR